ncbi:hypothetical protein Gotri_004680 [Gossypium trilobum]|uniref:MATH domain-containing protein n=1 Tax=Gossypium trilobum TaxID=34281 RepID=A0A7J9F5L0_9ROSI|nr:hypothetical protein [Gossypium trilobum]
MEEPRRRSFRVYKGSSEFILVIEIVSLCTELVVDDKTLLFLVGTQHCFNEREVDWGFKSFLRLTELYDPKKGYIVNGACLVEVYVSTNRTVDLISHKLMVKTYWDELKAKEVDRVKVVMDNRKTPTTKPVEITPLSPTQSSSQLVPAEEDMNTFFTSLESELSSSKIVLEIDRIKQGTSKNSRRN